MCLHSITKLYLQTSIRFTSIFNISSYPTSHLTYKYEIGNKQFLTTLTHSNKNIMRNRTFLNSKQDFYIKVINVGCNPNTENPKFCQLTLPRKFPVDKLNEWEKWGKKYYPLPDNLQVIKNIGLGRIWLDVAVGEYHNNDLIDYAFNKNPKSIYENENKGIKWSMHLFQ